MNFANLNPVYQALLGTLFSWGMTGFGAAFVYFTKKLDKKILDVMLGFAAGIMIAASFWSLLAPAIELSVELNLPKWLPAALGFMIGGLFLKLLHRILPHLHYGLRRNQANGIKTDWHKSTLLILAITLHNVPEGLAVGVAFGAAAAGLKGATVAGALALAIGLGLQNFPEGMAVSFPLRRTGMSRWKSFFYGQLSGIVEPISAVLGAALVLSSKRILPYALGFAAGAMIFVVAEELIPECQQSNNSDAATLGLLIGFTIMMILDVAMG